MTIRDEMIKELEGQWLPQIYRTSVRGQRTRAYSLDVAERENQAEIQYTLLGIELKVGKRRFSCPDLGTARYLRVFARLGIREFAIPYDITQISGAADELELAWQRTSLLIGLNSMELTSAAAAKLRRDIIKAIRGEIAEIGPGAAMPAFDRETRQRKA